MYVIEPRLRRPGSDRLLRVAVRSPTRPFRLGETISQARVGQEPSRGRQRRLRLLERISGAFRLTMFVAGHHSVVVGRARGEGRRASRQSHSSAKPAPMSTPAEWDACARSGAAHAVDGAVLEVVVGIGAARGDLGFEFGRRSARVPRRKKINRRPSRWFGCEDVDLAGCRIGDVDLARSGVDRDPAPSVQLVAAKTLDERPRRAERRHRAVVVDVDGSGAA